MSTVESHSGHRPPKPTARANKFLSVVCHSVLTCSLEDMCQSHTMQKRHPASIGVEPLGLQEDDLCLQTDHFCEERLFVVGECAASPALGV
jgi:hypothetical protein